MRTLFTFLTLTLSATQLAHAAPAKKTVDLKIGTKGSELFFDKKELSAPAGSTISLTFKNSANADTGLQHNFVLVQQGKADSVAAAGIAAGAAKGYVPDTPDVIIATQMLNPGETDKIRFQAPAQKGEYPFICSFPGHATTMRGVFKVR